VCGFVLQESDIEALLKEENIDLLVLARYMQVFSPDFCSRHASRTINIHHSFLPAFEGIPDTLRCMLHQPFKIKCDPLCIATDISSSRLPAWGFWDD
jgi:hypothetical protein